jgi:hypothetical protein
MLELLEFAYCELQGKVISDPARFNQGNFCITRFPVIEISQMLVDCSVWLSTGIIHLKVAMAQRD